MLAIFRNGSGMPLTVTDDPLAAAASLPSPDAPTVVVIPVFNAYDDVVRCYRSVLDHTADDVPVLVVDDASSDRRVVDVLAGLDLPVHRQITVLTKPVNRGFVDSMNLAFEMTGRSDIVILNSDVVVTAQWLERLSAAASSSSTIASVSTLTNHGTILSVPERNRPHGRMPDGMDIDVTAARIAAGSARLRPRIVTAIGHCTYLRRSALDLVGWFDPAFAPGYGEEVDWSQRALAAGLEHVAADDVFVFHRGGSSFGKSARTLDRQARHDRMINARYPYYAAAVAASAHDDNSPLAAALLAARRSMLGLHVAIDAFSLGPVFTGTQAVILETVRSLARRPEVAHLDVYTPRVIPDYVVRSAAELPNVRLVPELPKHERAPRADVALRPYQVRSVADVEWLRRMGERVVINQLDVIAFNNPSYFGNSADWLHYRDAQRLALASADGVSFISEAGRAAAVTAGLLPPHAATRVVYVGLEQYAQINAETPPSSAPDIQPGFVLVLGASFTHKNRTFALSAVRSMLKRGWDGELLLVGPEPTHGSSLPAEAEWLLTHRDAARHVRVLGEVTESEKVWLYRHAGVVFYPTTVEGFGMVPFEAAMLGAACVSSRAGSLDEILPLDIPTVDGHDAEQAADLLLRVLDDADLAKSMVDAMLERSRDFTWDGSSARLVDLMLEVTGRPGNATAAVAGEIGLVGMSGSVGSAARRQFDGLLRRAGSNPRLRALVPPGSQRQASVRRMLAGVQRRL